MVPSFWSKIYKRALLKINNVRFLETPGASLQDTGFILKAYAASGSAYFTTDAFYHYRLHPNQSVRQKDKYLCLLGEFAEVDRWLAQHPQFKKSEKYINARRFHLYRAYYDTISEKNRHSFQSKIREEIKEIIANDKTDKSRFTPNDWFFLQRVLYHDSIWLKVYTAWFKLRYSTWPKVRNYIISICNF
jgi:hypothetical protein